MGSCAATEGHRLLTKVFVLGGLFELDRRVPCAQLPLLCAASLERAAHLRGRAGNIMCVAGGSVAWRTRGRRVEGCGTFRGTVVEGEDARSKCWVLYNDDGLCYALARRRYTVVEDAEADSGPRNTGCLLYTSPSPRDRTRCRMPSSA